MHVCFRLWTCIRSYGAIVTNEDFDIIIPVVLLAIASIAPRIEFDQWFELPHILLQEHSDVTLIEI